MELSRAIEIFKKSAEEEISKWKKGSKQRKFLENNRTHSFEVLKNGEEILKMEKFSFEGLDDKIIENVKSALILHDIGRFYQHKLNGEFDWKIDHGKSGTEILLNKYKIKNNPYLILPMKYHNKIDLSQLDKDEEYLKLNELEQKTVKLLCHLVRDADKMANLLMIASEKGRVFSIRERELELNSGIIKALSEKRLVEKKLEKTVFDDKTANLCWKFDLFFDSSKKIYTKKEVGKRICQNMRNEAERIKERKIKENKENKLNVNKQFTKLIRDISKIEVCLARDEKKLPSSPKLAFVYQALVKVRKTKFNLYS